MYATISYQDIKKERYKKYGYYFCPDEKELTFYEATQLSSRIKYKFDLMNDDNNNLEKVYQLAFNKFIGVPFIKIGNNNEKQYLMPEIVQAVTGSDGMAAGNTLEEALVQGISEVYEHMVWNKVYENINKPTPELNFYKLKLPEVLKDKGNKLHTLGYNFKIFDYSYLYSIPVIGLLLIDQKNYNYSLILGSFPIFEIALERCFTEIYQGILSQTKKTNIAIPFKNLSDPLYYQYQHFSNLNLRECYNEQQFFNTIEYDNYNQKIFLNRQIITDKDLLNYYIELNNNLKLNFYYYNSSQCNNLFAVHVFLDNYNIFPHMHYQFIKNDNKFLKTKCLIFLYDFIYSTQQYLVNNNFNYLKNLFFNYKDQINQNIEFYNLIFDYLYYIPDLFSFYNKESDCLALFFKGLNGIKPNYYFNTFLNNNNYHFINCYYKKHKNIKKDILLLILLSQDKYDNNEIKTIFQNIFNINIKVKSLNKIILFKKIFLINLNKNNTYKKYIKKMVD